MQGAKNVSVVGVEVVASRDGGNLHVRYITELTLRIIAASTYTHRGQEQQPQPLGGSQESKS